MMNVLFDSYGDLATELRKFLEIYLQHMRPSGPISVGIRCAAHPSIIYQVTGISIDEVIEKASAFEKAALRIERNLKSRDTEAFAVKQSATFGMGPATKTR